MSNASKKIVKRRKVNKKKLLIVIISLFLIIFLVIKGLIFIYGLISKDVINNETKISNAKLEQFDLNEEGKKNKRYTVFIDPGHGGHDGGSIIMGTKIYEKDIVLDIAKKVSSILLKQNDIEVILTRADDRFIELDKRAEMANKQEGDIFVSIHLNSFPDIPDAIGVETYHTKDDVYNSNVLATSIQETIVSYVPSRDRGVKTANFEVLQVAKMPSVLIELGFLSNKEEAKDLQDEAYKEELAQGVAQGILTFIDENLK